VPVIPAHRGRGKFEAILGYIWRPCPKQKTKNKKKKKAKGEFYTVCLSVEGMS
jgi:hypothetical protein